MRKLLSSPVKMALSDAENAIYQNTLKYVTDISLNLMAVKVVHRPEDFLSWCAELLRICRHDINVDLLEPEQHRPLKKIQEILEQGVSVSQLKMLRIAPWPIFVHFITQQNTRHALDERFKLLTHIQEIRNTPLADMIEEDRLVFAGKHTSSHDHSIYNFDAEWFGSTKGAKVFHQLLLQKPIAFDEALSHIPLEGDVSFNDYQNFVTAYQGIFQQAEANAPLAPASRLLAMRRPDQFIALTNAKIDVLCQGLSIAKFNNQDLLSYWRDMITTLHTFAWWHTEMPETVVQQDKKQIDEQENQQSNEEGCEQNTDLTPDSNMEKVIWQNRAILIDVFLFADETLADNSNYLKVKNRALNVKNLKSNASSVARKRTTESAEMLVDRALSADDLPDYLKTKRDSIVNEVKNGKSVDHVIGLMRAIFG